MNTKFKFIFEKTSKKYNCPSCGKKSFTRMHHVDTKEFLPDEYGICDRVNNCNYIRTPDANIIAGFKEKKETTSTSNSIVHYYDDVPDFIDPNVFTASLKGYEYNNFVQFLYKSFDKENVDRALKLHHVGTSNLYKGGTIFWQVCYQGAVRSGTVMKYDLKTGKRKKGGYFNYVHSALQLKHFNYGRCLYGEHLLKYNPKKIGIVESEKTAVIMSVKAPEFTWLATSGINNFKYELLSSLKPLTSNSIIIAYPDKGGFENWNDVADNIRSEIQIKVSDILEKDEYEDGCDIADNTILLAIYSH